MSRIREHIPEASVLTPTSDATGEQMPRTATLQITDDLELLLEILPERIQQALQEADGPRQLPEGVVGNAQNDRATRRGPRAEARQGSRRDGAARSAADGAHGDDRGKNPGGRHPPGPRASGRRE